MIIAVCGLPGSGKSFFAKRLAGDLNAAYLSSDKLRKSLIEVPRHTPEEKKLVYKTLFEMVKDLAGNGDTIVVDATFHKAERRAQIAALSAVARIVFIEVKADEKIVKERTSRDRDYSDADFEVYLKIKDESEPFTQAHLVLESTNDNISEMLKTAHDHLKHLPDETD
ncbi:AAA family ATPase [Halocola ammonii]